MRRFSILKYATKENPLIQYSGSERDNSGGQKVNKKRIFVVLALIFIVASTGVLVGRWSIVGAEGEGYEDLKVFTEALTMVRKSYVEEAKTKGVVYGAIKGVLRS